MNTGEPILAHAPALAVACALCLAAAGCTATAHLGSVKSLASAPNDSTDPFLRRGQYPEQLGQALSEVLLAHRFEIPWLAVRAPDASLWFVTERLDRSANAARVDRVQVRVTPQRTVSARIIPYARGPSDWGTLGSAFANPKPEADAIAAELAGKLRDSSWSMPLP